MIRKFRNRVILRRAIGQCAAILFRCAIYAVFVKLTKSPGLGFIVKEIFKGGVVSCQVNHTIESPHFLLTSSR